MSGQRSRFIIRQLFLDHLVAVFGVAGFLIVTAALCASVYASWRITVERIVASTEEANVALTRAFVNEEWARLHALLPPSSLRDRAQLQARPQNAAIAHIVRRFSAGTDLLKLKIYDMSGLTVYSSDARQIGDDQSGNPGFLNARRGRAISELTFRGQFGAFDGVVHDRNLVSSYLPALRGSRIEAVVETYTDRTASIAAANRAMAGLSAVLAPLLYSVYAALLYLVWRADGVRREHQRALKEAVAESARARAAAESANRSKSQFLASMSHEMRTPLTAIIGYAQSGLAHRPDPHAQAENLRTIARNGEHLLNVINDLLDLAKIEAGKLDVVAAPLDLFELLADVHAVALAHAGRKGIGFALEYCYPLPQRIVTDATRLKEILLNVTNNAIKFTHAGGVTLRVGYESGARRMRFTVADTGVGMTAEHMARLFQPFAQADAGTSRRYGGTGLGLHISRRLAELLGGTIAVHSKVGAGSVFEIRIAAPAGEPVRWISGDEPLPRHGAAELEPAAAPRLAGAILLAEDHPDNRNLLRLYIEPTGARLDAVENGERAVECALQHEYDLVLMDMQMPVMDGSEAARLLRQAGYDRPIVALTASATSEEVARYADAGCDRVLSKPLDWKRFYATLAAYLPPAAKGAGRTGEARTHAGHAAAALARRFEAAVPARLATMRELCAAGRWSELAAALHDMKGMGAAFGHPELTRMAASMERAIAQGCCDGLHADIARLAASWPMAGQEPQRAGPS